MNRSRVLAIVVLSLAAAVPAEAGLLTAQGVAALDSGGAARPSFSNTERITFQQRVHNGAASSQRIVFKFIVLSPAGSQVFEHNGNAVPGAVGSAASQISGVPLASLDRGPGVYTVKASAALDGQTLEQVATFTLSSPNILLLYPPHGAQGVADVPLTLRWSGSGATRYRVTVGNNPSFFNAVFNQETTGGESFLSYPVNPPELQKLGSGQVYYWKVEGLDAGGLKIAQSQAPFSFTVQSAPLSKDMAVTALELRPGDALPGQMPFRVAVLNQGGTAEGNMPLRLSVGGLPAPGTPISLPSVAPGESKEFSLAAAIPSDQSQSLAIACVEFSDNNLANNCKTLLVNRPTPPPAADRLFQKAGPVSGGAVWGAIKDLLRERGIAQRLEGYDLVGMEGSVSTEEMAAILDALKKGQAQVNLSGPVARPPPLPPPPPTPAPSAPPSAPPPVARRPEPDVDAEKPAPAKGKAPLPAPAKKPPAEEASLKGTSAEELAKKKAKGGGGKKGGDSRPATPEEEAAVGSGPEWGGMAEPSSDETATLTITGSRQWSRAWGGLGEGDAPQVDFEKLMVVGIVAGRKDKAIGIEVKGIAVTEEGVQVRYRFLKGDGRGKVPFALKVVPASKAAVEFKRVKGE